MKPSESAVLERNEQLRQWVTHHRAVTNPIADFAKELLKAHPVFILDAQDEWKARFRVFEPQEIVDRCVAMADIAFAAFEQKGWLIEVPPLEEMRAPPGPTGFRGS